VSWYHSTSIPTNFICDQHAFRPTGSTTVCLASLFHHSTRLLADNSFARCLLIDFSFDTVPHSILLDKLETYGWPATLLTALGHYSPLLDNQHLFPLLAA
jgi:hypothetical protein